MKSWTAPVSASGVSSMTKEEIDAYTTPCILDIKFTFASFCDGVNNAIRVNEDTNAVSYKNIKKKINAKLKYLPIFVVFFVYDFIYFYLFH